MWVTAADRKEALGRLAVQRESFLSVRGCTRALIAYCFGVPAGSLSFGRLPSGKPVVAGTLRGCDFSVGYDRSKAIVAVADGVSVGADTEEVRDGVAMATIVAEWFGPAVEVELARCAADERKAAFFRLWCLAEAAGKVTGRGISQGRLRGLPNWAWSDVDGWQFAVAVARRRACTYRFVRQR
jgi:phosphopantetheinyl transferase